MLVRSLFVLVLVSLLPVADGAMGQSAGAFARMGFGARGLAMGNAVIADIHGDASPYYNPALAPYIASQNLELSAAALTLDRQMQFVQLSTPLRPRAGLAAGLIHAGVRNIDGRDGSGYHTSYYSTDEYAFVLAFGIRILSRASLGVGLQLFRTDLFDGVPAARTIGFDVGVSMRITDELSLGAAADDLLARYSWDTSDIAGGSTSDLFPRRLRWGASYRLESLDLLLSAEFESRIRRAEFRRRSVQLVGNVPREIFESELLRLHDARVGLGAELGLPGAFAVRGGLSGLADDGFATARPSAGFVVEQGLGALLARAEYTFLLEPFALGSMHVVSLRVSL